MEARNYDLTKVLKKEHEEKWVALNKEQTKVIDYSSALSELRNRIGEKNREVVYMKVPRSDTIYAF
jgi:hypothetical protein